MNSHLSFSCVTHHYLQCYFSKQKQKRKRERQYLVKTVDIAWERNKPYLSHSSTFPEKERYPCVVPLSTSQWHGKSQPQQIHRYRQPTFSVAGNTSTGKGNSPVELQGKEPVNLNQGLWHILVQRSFLTYETGTRWGSQEHLLILLLCFLVIMKLS